MAGFCLSFEEIQKNWLNVFPDFLFIPSFLFVFIHLPLVLGGFLSIFFI